jgi:hypothetical protein
LFRGRKDVLSVHDLHFLFNYHRSQECSLYTEAVLDDVAANVVDAEIACSDTVQQEQQMVEYVEVKRRWMDRLQTYYWLSE